MGVMTVEKLRMVMFKKSWIYRVSCFGLEGGGSRESLVKGYRFWVVRWVSFEDLMCNIVIMVEYCVV